LVSLFSLTPAFLGMTIGAWGGNIGGEFFILDVVNSSMAAK